MIAGMALMVVGLAGIGWWWYQSTHFVSTDDARVSGTIVTVSSKIPGKIQGINAKEGDTVNTSQELVSIDARDAKAQKAKAIAALSAAKARFEQAVNGSRPQEIEQVRAASDQAKASLVNAHSNFVRMQKLFDQGAISASMRDNAEAAYLVAKETAVGAQQKLDLTIAGTRDEEVQAAAALMKVAEADLELATLTEEYTRVFSPVNGIIAVKYANHGEVVAAGQPLFSVVAGNDLWLSARIEETKIGKIKIGQRVDYKIDGYPGQRFTGKVYEIGIATNSTFALIPTENASGNFTKVTQRIPIKISLPEKADGVIFRPGMQAIVDIYLQ